MKGVLGLFLGGFVGAVIFALGAMGESAASGGGFVYALILSPLAGFPIIVLGAVIGLFVGLGIGGSNRKFVYPKGVLCNKCGTAIGKGATTCAVCGADMNDLTDI